MRAWEGPSKVNMLGVGPNGASETRRGWTGNDEEGRERRTERVRERRCRALTDGDEGTADDLAPPPTAVATLGANVGRVGD